MKEEHEYLALAKITRPRGNRGEVVADNFSTGLRGLEPGRTVEVALPNQKTIQLQIASAWEHRGRVVLGFDGFESISDAERLRGALVQVIRGELDPLPEGEFYLDDLVGCVMTDEATGRDMGRVEDVYEPPGGVLLLSVMDENQKELLVPMANEICKKIDVGARRITVRLPEGMEDLKA